MAQTYTYLDARNLFWSAVGVSPDDEESILEGEAGDIETTSNLWLTMGERRTAMILAPFYQAGMAPFMNTLAVSTNFEADGSTKLFALPDDFLIQLSGTIQFSTSATDICPITFLEPTEASSVWQNPYKRPGTGTHKMDYVPALIQNSKLEFFASVSNETTPVSNNITLRYFKIPQAVSGDGSSDLHAACLEFTVYNTAIYYNTIAGEDIKLASAKITEENLSKLYEAATKSLGFDPQTRG